MSQIDRAFIQAYRRHAAGGAPDGENADFTAPLRQLADAPVRIDPPHMKSALKAARLRVPTPHLQLPAGAAGEGQTGTAAPWPEASEPSSQEPSRDDRSQAVRPLTMTPVPPRAGRTPWRPQNFLAASGRRVQAAPAANRTAHRGLAGPNARGASLKATDLAAARQARIEQTLQAIEGECATRICVGEEAADRDAAAALADSLSKAMNEMTPAESASERPAQAPLESQAKTVPPSLASASPPVVTADQAAAQPASLGDQNTASSTSGPQPAPASPAAAEAVQAAPAAEAGPTVEPPGKPAWAAEPSAFQPQWEVDQFHWPKIVEKALHEAQEQIDQACGQVRDMAQEGENVFALAGVEKQSGATTLALAMAKRLGAWGLKVALVDADFDEPSLAQRLGVRVQDGWEATLAQRLPLAEVCVASLGDNLTLVPLVARQGVSSTLASMNAAAHVRRLRELYDIVLIDAGSGSENVAAVITSSDEVLHVSVILAVDQRHAQDDETGEVIGRLEHIGARSIRLGQTFAAA